MRQTIHDVHEPAELYAWVGEDEFGSGEVGLKQFEVRSGSTESLVPLVVIAGHKLKITQPRLIRLLQSQADEYRKVIRLVRYVYAEEVITLVPAERS